MSRYLNDGDGDSVRIEKASPPYEGLVVSAIQRGDDEVMHHAIVGPIDPRKLIAQIHAEMGWDRPKEEPGDCPGETIRALADQLNTTGGAAVDFEETTAEEAETGERPPRASTMHVHVKPVIDEDEWGAALETVTGHWERRLKVVEQAMALLPAPGKRGGLAAAFAGEVVEDPHRVEKALKIARFAADEDREIPGVDR